MRKISQKKYGKHAIVFMLCTMVCIPFQNAASIPQQFADDTEYWALLVGIGVYAENPEQNRPDMLLEVQDLHTLLIQSDWWPEDHVRVIEGENATVVNIIAGLRWLDRMEDGNDFSFIYFSTHGFPLNVDIPPKDEADGTDEALASYWGFAYPSLFIWDDELNVLLNRLESQGVCLVVDSCYAGGFNDPPNWNITDFTHPPQNHDQSAAKNWINEFGKEVLGQKRVVIMASCEDEVSYSGGFGPYVIDGLRGHADFNEDGTVSAEEVFAYAEPRSERQNPTLFDGYEGELPIINVASTLQSAKNPNVLQENQPKDNTVIKPAQFIEETSILCGYIRDVVTTDPIENALVSVRGRINDYEYYENQTMTNATGFYRLSTPAIRLRMTVSAEGYCDESADWIQMQENKTKWVNFTLTERPPETAIICGYIIDKNTTSPLAMANVSLFWYLNEEQSYRNDTTSDVQGFYQMSVAAGTINVDIEKKGYFSEHIEEHLIHDDETLWWNVSLDPMPLENAIICGYVRELDTSEPLSGIRLEFEWVNIAMGVDYRNDTMTNTSGFYSISIAPGEVYLSIREQGYDYYDPYRHDAIADSMVWLNRSLTRSIIEVEIAKPLKALYRNNERIMPFIRPQIIGAIDIVAYIPGWWGDPGDAEKIEFYIDGALQATLTEQPYNWTWSKKTFGKHTIKVIAYDFNGDVVSKELEVHKFL